MTDGDLSSEDDGLWSGTLNTGQQSIQASVKPSDNEIAVSNYHNNVEKAIETLSVNQVNMATDEENTTTLVSGVKHSITFIEHEDAFRPTNKMRVDDYEPQSSQTLPFETLGIGTESPTIHIQCKPKFDDITTGNTPTFTEQISPEKKKTLTNIPPHLEAQPINNPNNNDETSLLSCTGVSDQGSIFTTLEIDTQAQQRIKIQETSCISKTENRSAESSEQPELHQHATPSQEQRYEEEVQQSINNNRDNCYDQDRNLVDVASIKRRNPSDRRPEDEDDEGGERGTVIILKTSYHRRFGLAKNSSTTINNTFSDAYKPNQSQSGSHEVVPADSLVEIAENINPLITKSNPVGNTNDNVYCHDNHKRIQFTLEPSGLDFDENTLHRSGSISPVPYFSQSPSAPSASSSSAPSPISARQTQQRPYSQLQPRSIFKDDPSDQSISLSSQSQKDEFLQGQFQQIQQHLRRSRSLPSTTCSSESSRHEAQQQQRQQQRQQQLASEAHLWLTSCMSESKRSAIVKDQALEGEHDIESNGSIRVKSIRNSQQNFQLLSSPIQKDDTITEESSVSPLVTSMQTSGLQMRSPSSERPRRQSLLSPRQFEMMNQQQHQREQQPQQNLLSSSLSSAFGKKGGFSSFLKDHTGRSKNKSNTADSRVVSNSSDNSQKQRQKQKQKQKKKKRQERPTASNTPTISFQPHSTEISTDRPSVSGRLVLHIPQLPGLKFHFVSLALHLRLKESISWVRKDIVSFETEKHHWSQIVWDKKMMLPFQDRQVEEGTEAGFTTSAGKNLSAAAAVAAAVSASSASASANEPTQQHSSQRDLNLNIPTTSTATLARGSHQQSNISTKSDHNDYAPTMDEWRWEWLLPVSRSEVRPESFEGSLGMVWYELEAKCLFRWDKVNEDGHVTQSNDLQSSTSHAYLDGGANRSNKLLKGLGASTNKSIAQVFGKLRAGNKSKKARVHAGHAGHAGDFKLNSKHNEFIKSSHSKSKEALENETKEQTTTGEVTDDPDTTATTPTNPCNATDTDNEPTQDLNSISQPQSSTKLVPFLIRKTLKLYFNKSPPRESSNPAFFLPQPSMSLPNLPSTRRLKAIIPGAKVQVLIQVPSMVSIPSYSQTSRLTPCSKTGGLVEVKKGSKASGDSGHRGDKTVYNLVGKKIKCKRTAPILQQQLNKDGRLPNSFQAALTIRKVTRQDIKDDSFLRRRYENAQLAADAISNSLAQHHQTSGTSPKPAPRKRMLSHTSGTGSQAGGSAGEQSDTSSVFNNNSAVEARLQGHNRAWRKEIQVRNVKCEFWQKETCRIPLEDVPIRSIRVPIGDTFTYSEMEQEKERQRQGNNQKSFHQHVGSSMDTNNLTTSNMAPFRKEISSRSSSPAPPACGDNSLPLRSSPHFGGGVAWKESLGSVKPQQQHGLAPTKTSSNQPFTLLIPVHLDSKKLRQTFVWPSSETPSPIAPPGYDHSAARGSNGTFGLDSSVLGYGSELDYRSQFSMNEMGSFIGNGVETTRGTDGGVGGAHGNNNNDNNINNNNGQVNTPPVAARIEVEHYLAIRLSIDVLEFEGECEHDDDDLDMAMGGNNEHCNNGDDNTLLMTAPRLPFAPASNVSLTAQTIGNSMAPPPPLSNTLSPTAIEPALNFLTSAAGLLNMDAVGEPGPVSVGTTYDLSKRRGSKSSHNETGSSSQQTLNVSSSVGGNGSNSGGGLISSTLGVLKKKASVTALSNNNRRQVNVQRLKDYVIRVPITVVVQVDERGKLESAYRRMSGSENNRIDVTQTTRFDENSRRNVTTTATTTTTNIVTGSSRPIRVSVEGTETFSSLNSLAASADSESVKKRMMDDFADTSSSALMFAGIKNRQGASLGPVNSHQNALQYLQGLRHHSSRKQGVFGNSDISSSLVKGDGDARQEIHDDEDEEGDFVVVDAQEIAEDYIEEDS